MSLLNRELMKRASANLTKKIAVIAAGDPALGGSPMPDPSAGGAPPGGMPPGGDPAAMGGMPPPAPAPAPAPAPMQPAMAGGVEPIKPKIDVNVTLLQILKVQARIADALGIKIPASEMVATQGDLTSMGMQQETGAAGTPLPPAGGQPPAGGPAPIGPIDPNMGGAGGGMPKAANFTRLGNFGKRAVAELTFLGK
jgi:hypothetical protein